MRNMKEMTRRNTVLLADDEDTLRTNLAQVLEEEGFDVIACPDGTRALRALKMHTVDVLVTDLRMPGICGMDLIDHAKKLCPEASIVVITSYGEVETAVEAMKKGAKDYLCKPLIFDELIFKLKRLLAHDGLARENRLLREQIRQVFDPAAVVAKSPAMVSIVETVKRVGKTMSNVLLYGKSGTGKEVLARMLHYSGITSDKPFVVVNCGGLVDTLVESELFGYRRGAFTGAESDRTGYFEAADGGTLFLDEIGNLPLASQAVLLRAIEDKAVTRVGDNRPRPVNIRIVAATNRDLGKAIEEGEFREDLYFRLNVVHLAIPPLRDRPEDIPALVDHFVALYNRQLNTSCPGFSDEAMEAMCQYHWRGNVRELENVVEHALIFAGERPVGLEHLSIAVAGGTVNRVSAIPLRDAMREFERRHISKVLERHNSSKAAAAEALGIGLSSLYRKMEELGLSKTDGNREQRSPANGRDVGVPVRRNT
ncbi:MAG: sigma-54-dependent Fis family transcriptional regulator [Phycisphaerales bacterium]|nr:MAG: sigma-54-dependent Fis family transcriptional regulator [Phycisphaerales bacterium]